MHTALCAFEDRARAEQAVDALVRSGIARHDVHIEHKHLHRSHETGTDRWDGMEREVAVDRSVLASFGAFFASLLGRDHPSGHVDTYGQHVERGNYVVVVDAHDQAEADRARVMLQDMEARDLNMVHRPEQRPLRDVVGMRQEGIAGEPGTAGMVERSRTPYEGSVSSNMEERAVASSPRVSPNAGPDLRDPDLGREPGLRYADKDKPNG